MYHVINIDISVYSPLLNGFLYLSLALGEWRGKWNCCKVGCFVMAMVQKLNCVGNQVREHCCSLVEFDGEAAATGMKEVGGDCSCIQEWLDGFENDVRCGCLQWCCDRGG